MPSGIISVFLDSNILVELFDKGNFQQYLGLSRYPLLTFEKCLYEYKNGIKRCLLDPEFIKKAIKESPSCPTQTGRKACDLIIKSIRGLAFSEDQLREICRGVGKYDLYFEFGIAEEGMDESLYQDNSKNGDYILVRKLFVLLKQLLDVEFHELEILLERNGIKVLLYEEVFGDPRKVAEFRRLLDESYLPTEDLEIVFAAMNSGNSLFVTNDDKLRKKAMSLGLNHSLEFISLENLGEFIRQ